MALVDMGFRLAVTLLDNGANVTTLQFQLRSADFANAVIDSGAVLTALGNMSNSVVSDYYIKNRWSESALAYPAAGVENEDKASITVLLAGAGNKKANIKVPAPKIDIFTAASGGGANVVDLSDAAVIAYTDLFKALAECYISDGEDLSALVSGKRISAGSQSG